MRANKTEEEDEKKREHTTTTDTVCTHYIHMLRRLNNVSATVVCLLWASDVWECVLYCVAVAHNIQK